MIANLIVAETISWDNFQPFNVPYFFSFDQLPSANDRSPHLLIFLARLKRVLRCFSYSGHLNRKWSTDSDSQSYLPISVLTASILAKYLFNLNIADFSWQITLASSFDRLLYNFSVCLPERASSIRCVNFSIADLVHVGGGVK